MKILLAPSKSMDVSPIKRSDLNETVPFFVKESTFLRQKILGLSIKEMSIFFGISEKKATEVFELFRDNIPRMPAFFLYAGDVYKGVFARTFSKEDMLFSQDTVLVLSGLYGALRPLDSIFPYRLEMRQKINFVEGSANISDFWGRKIYEKYAKNETLIVNCSSDEYSKTITKFLHEKQRCITPVFVDIARDGRAKTVPIYSKMMRGVFAKYLIDTRVKDSTIDKIIQGFSQHGYSFDAKKSTANSPVFFRRKMTPLIFIAK